MGFYLDPKEAPSASAPLMPPLMPDACRVLSCRVPDPRCAAQMLKASRIAGLNGGLFECNDSCQVLHRLRSDLTCIDLKKMLSLSLSFISRPEKEALRVEKPKTKLGHLSSLSAPLFSAPRLTSKCGGSRRKVDNPTCAGHRLGRNRVIPDAM